MSVTETLPPIVSVPLVIILGLIVLVKYLRGTL